MKTYLLILVITQNAGAITTVPTEYSTETACNIAGRAFVNQWINARTFTCIPSGNNP